MRSAPTILAGLTLALASPIAAQDRADKARLDDFALPKASSAEEVEQLGAREKSLAITGSSAGDRTVIVPGPVAGERAPVLQLSQPGQPTPTVQLSGREESRQLAVGSVSSPEDSKPRTSAPLGGSDKCDPQLDGERLNECLRVLELRAAEFSAPEAPRLSAEQALLARQGPDNGQLAQRSPTTRLRTAANDPDADIQSNQELATIYLSDARAAASAATEMQRQQEEATAAERGLMEILQQVLPQLGAN